MKKIVAITLALLVLAGCSSETYTSGLGMVNSIGSSKSATEEAAGLAQADVTAASVMLDSKGTIVGISFDVVQTKVNFDATGTITTDLATEFKTKKELKEDYNKKTWLLPAPWTSATSWLLLRRLLPTPSKFSYDFKKAPDHSGAFLYPGIP